MLMCAVSLSDLPMNTPLLLDRDGSIATDAQSSCVAQSLDSEMIDA